MAKNQFIKLLVLLLFAVIFSVRVVAAGYTRMGNAALIAALDSAITGNEALVAERINSINNLKNSLSKTSDEKKKYWIHKNLCDLYSQINADSALVYASHCLTQAQNEEDETTVANWMIKKLALYRMLGYFNNADDLISEISELHLTQEQEIAFMLQVMLMQSDILQYNSTENQEVQGKYFNKLIDKLGSIESRLDVNEPSAAVVQGWLTFLNPDSKGDADIKAAELEKIIDSTYTASALDPVPCYMVATYYNRQAENDKAQRYYLLTALAEMRNGTFGDITPAMKSIADGMYRNGDLDHAFSYINTYSDIVSGLNNKVAMLGSQKLKNDITTAYIERTHSYERTLNAYLIATSTLVVLLLVALYLILRQIKRIRDQKSAIEGANETTKKQLEVIRQTHEELQNLNLRLSEANAALDSKILDLEKANSALDEANLQKEAYIASLFQVCSDYISQLDDFRKSIARKLKTGQISEASYALSQTTVVQEGVKAFYQNFDNIFLNLYPNFVKGLNDLLLPEERLSLKDSELLNTELRIFALQRLGITDANKIADLLHCSVQTIYNCRQRMYRRTTMSKHDFTEAIQQVK